MKEISGQGLMSGTKAVAVSVKDDIDEAKK